MKNLTMKKPVIAVAIVLGFISAPVYAASCALTPECVMAINSAKSSLSKQMALMESTLKSAILMVGSEIQSAINQSVTTQMKHDRELADAKNRAEIENARNVKKHQAVIDSAPTSDECTARGIGVQSAEVMKSMRQSSKNFNAYHQAVAGRSSGGSSSAANAANTHHELYCDPKTDVACPAAHPNELGGKMDNADVNVESITSGVGGTDASRRILTPEQVAAAKIFTENATAGGFAPRRLSAAEMDTPKGKLYEAKRLDYEATASVSRKILGDNVAYITPSEGSQAIMKTILDGAKGTQSEAYIKREVNSLNSLPSPITGKISPARLIELEATRRFLDEGWYKDIQSADQVTLLREMAHMMASNLYMQHQQAMREEVSAINTAMTAKSSLKKLQEELITMDNSMSVNHK